MTVIWIIIALFIGLVFGIIVGNAQLGDYLKQDGYILKQDPTKKPGQGRYSIYRIDTSKRL